MGGGVFSRPPPPSRTCFAVLRSATTVLGGHTLQLTHSPTGSKSKSPFH